MRSFSFLLLDSSEMKSSWRRSAHKLILRGGTVGVVSLPPLSPPPLLPPPPWPPFFSVLPLSYEKSLPSPSSPLLLDSLVRSMSMFSFLLEVVMLL